jgi:nucleotide-binding universal stress UspA family protein
MPEHHSRRDGKKAIMVTQILCAIDDAEHSETAAEFAIDLARRLSAKLVFQMVNPAVLPSPRGAPVYLWTDDYIRGYLEEALRRARQAGVGLATCETARANSIPDSIVACADFHEADLIVIGASGRRTIADLFRRPVSRIVADTANCPVLIIRRVRNRWPRQGSLPYCDAA